MNIGILGAGAWGTALAKYLSEFTNTKHNIAIYSVESSVVAAINKQRVNDKYLPNCNLLANVVATNDINSLLNTDIILLTTPVKFIAETIKAFNSNSFNTPILICAKGIDTLNAELVSEILQNNLNNPQIGVLSGPSFASEYVKGLPAGLVLAMETESLAAATAKNLDCSNIKIYSSNDIIGTQIGGAVKNILAIASGIISGLNLGHNALSAMITRGLYEIALVIAAKGGNKQTAYGLSGLGDLVLTATSSESRNFSLGVAIAKNNGYSADLTPSKAGIAEGYYTSFAIKLLAQKYNLDLPICNEVYQILYQAKSPKQSIGDLLARDIRSEF